MDTELGSTLTLVLVVVLSAISMGLLVLLVKGPVERLIGRFVDRTPSGEGTGALTKTFSFTFGTRPHPELLEGAQDLSVPSTVAASLDPSRRHHYLEQWRRAQAMFAHSPDSAVREAHRLVGDLMRELGIPAAQLGQAASLKIGEGDAISAVGDVVGLLQAARSAARGINQANAYREADAEDLASAMDLYRRVVANLLPEGPSQPSAS